MTYTYQDRARVFVARGLPVFPCRGKKPMTEHGLHDAIRLVDGRVPENANVGVRMGNGYFAVDLDTHKVADDDVRKMHDQLRASLPGTMRQETISGGEHWIFYSQKPVRNSASKIAPHVDVRGEGGYLASGPGYTVHDADIAEAPTWLVDAIHEAAKKDVKPRAALVPVRPIDVLGETEYGRRALLSECARVCNLQEGERNDELLRSANRMGGLVAGGHLDRARVLDELTSAAMVAGLSEREAVGVIERALDHTKGDPRGPVPREREEVVIIDDSLGDEEIVIGRPASVAVVEQRRTDVARTSEDVALAVARLGGPPADYVRWVLESADYPQPGLAVASMLALGASLGARRLVLSGLTSSMLVVGVAATSSGKGRPQSCLTEALSSEWPALLAGSDLSSTAATIETVASSADRGTGATFVLDEYGARLKAMLDSRSGHQRDMRAAILTLSTTGTGSYRESKSLGRGGGQRIIHAPGLTIYGSTTPTTLHDALGQAAVDDGLVGRHIWLTASDVLPARRWHDQAVPLPESVRAAVARARAHHEAWWASLPPSGASSTNGIPMLSYKPISVLMTPGARLMVEQWGEHVDERRRRRDHSEEAPLLGRAVEHVLRVSLSLLSLLGDMAYEVGEEIVECAIRIVEESVRVISSSIAEYAASTEYESHVQRVRRALRDAPGEGWATSTMLSRACRALKPDERKRALDDMVSSGDVEQAQDARGLKVWRLVREGA